MERVLQEMPYCYADHGAPCQPEELYIEGVHGDRHAGCGQWEPDERYEPPWRLAACLHPVRAEQAGNAWQSGVCPRVVLIPQCTHLSDKRLGRVYLRVARLVASDDS